MRDRYDPPPALTEEYALPKPERLVFTIGDSVCLIALCAVLLGGSMLAWRTEPELAICTAAAGSLVILESWFTALGFLHRTRPLKLKLRWLIFLAAIVPWLIGLGVAVSAMLLLFWISDSYLG
jgi:hypothetical protein